MALIAIFLLVPVFAGLNGVGKGFGFVLCHLPKNRQDRLKEWDNFRRKYSLMPYFLVGSKLPPRYVALNHIACAKCP